MDPTTDPLFGPVFSDWKASLDALEKGNTDLSNATTAKLNSIAQIANSSGAVVTVAGEQIATTNYSSLITG